MRLELERKKKRFRTAFESDKQAWWATRQTYTVGRRAERKKEESADGGDCKVDAKCDEERLAKSFSGRFGPALLDHGWGQRIDVWESG